MKAKYLGVLALAAAANSALATIVYDPFEYDATSTPRLDGLVNPNGKTWQVAGTGAGPNPSNNSYLTSAINAGNLTAPVGTAPTRGNHLTWGSNGLTAPDGVSGVADRVDVAGINNGTVYWSMLFRIDDLGNAANSDTGAFVAGFNNSIGAQPGTISAAAPRLVIRKDANDPTKFDIGLSVSTNSAPPQVFDKTTPRDVGTTYFIVASYTILGVNVGGATPTRDDGASMWVNPDPATFGTDTPPAPTLTIPSGTANGNDIGPGTTGFDIASFYFRQAGTAPKTMSADELRLDTTWAGVTGVEWVSTGNNTWSTASNWSNFYTGSTGSAPGAQGADLTFGTISTQHNVVLDSPRTAGAIRFRGTTSYTISGAQLTLDTPTTGALNVGTDTSASYVGGAANPATVVVYEGSHTISAPLLLNRSTTLNVASGGQLTISGNLTSSGTVTLSKLGTGMNVLHPPSVQVSSGVLKLAPGLETIQTGSINVASGASLDITSGKFIYDYANGNAPDSTRLAAVQAMVSTGYGGGAWTGAGITSATAASVAADANNANKTAVGFAEASAAGISSFAGVSTDGDMIVLRYTYAGDANLSGTVDSSDFGVVAAHFNQSGQTWVSGDFNYDGVVNGLDFNAIATNFGAAAISSPALGALVPEPCAALLLLALPLFGSRRRART